MKMGQVAEIMMLLGMLIIVIAGFVVNTALGLFLVGVFTIVIGALLFVVHLNNVVSEKTGGD